jgi:molybdopterin-binding protein
MMDEKLYTPEDLAHILQFSKYTIYEMIKRGDIPAHHIGKSIRISQFQLDQYLISARKAENVFNGEIILDSDGNYALVNGLKIYVSSSATGQVKICIDPENIILSLTDLKCSARNVMKGTVRDITNDNLSAKILLDVGIPIQILITKRTLDEMAIKNGDELFAVFKAMSVKIVKI